MQRWIDNTARLDAKQKIKSLKQTKGIKKYIEEMKRLNDYAGYPDDVLQDYIRPGLDFELADRWMNQPRALEDADYPAWRQRLIDLGTQLEYCKSEKKVGSSGGKSGSNKKKWRNRDKDSNAGNNTSGDKEKEKKEMAEKPESRTSSTGRVKKTKKKGSIYKDLKVWLKGVSFKLRNSRRDKRQCKCCGVKGHKFYECPNPINIGKKVAAVA